MQATLKPVEADDPHDAPAIAPEIIPAAWADKVLADIKQDATSQPSDQPPQARFSTAGAAPQLSIDTTFRASAGDHIHAPSEKRPARKWFTSTAAAFLFALSSGLAAAAWPHYGDAAKDVAKQMIANWTPQFALNASPAPQQTAPAEQTDTPAVQAAVADQTPPQPTASAPPAEGAAPEATVPAPESSQAIQSMARDLAAMGQQIEQLKAEIAELKAGRQPVAGSVARTSETRSAETARPAESKPAAIRSAIQNARPKTAALPPPQRPAVTPVRRPVAYPPMQATAAPPLPPAAPSVAVPAQAVADPADEPVVRPPMPLR